jgi:hypothetical protein
VGRVEFFEDVGLEFAVGAHGLDDLLALLVTGLLDEVGDLCGVEFRELAVGMRSRAVGTCATNGSMEAKSTMASGLTR